MCFILNDGSNFKLFYSEPVLNYVRSHSGSLFSVAEYEEMVNSETCIEVYELMSDYSVSNGWADLSMNNHGLNISNDVAKYILQGKALAANEYIEIETKTIEGENEHR